MDISKQSSIAKHLGSARQNKRIVKRPPDELTPSGQNEAYQAMKTLHTWFSDNGLGENAGYKIGCTTAVQQAHVGFDQPLGGGVLSKLVYSGNVNLSSDEYRRIGIETELAVRLKSSPPIKDAPYDCYSIARYVGEVMAALEIVDDRYDDYHSWPVESLIADDFFNAGCVLGEPFAPETVDLKDVTATTIVNGIEYGSGSGVDVMGHPYKALSHLVNTLAAAGISILEGELVLTGSLVQTHWTTHRSTKYLCSYSKPFGDLQIFVE